MRDFFRVVPKKRSIRLHKKQGILLKNPGIVGKSIFYAGCFSILFAFGYFVYLYQPLASAIFAYERQKIKIDPVVNIPTVYPTPTMGIVQDNRFLISIPKIYAEAEIQPNVLTQSKDEYMGVLRSGKIAHASESSLPGSGKGTSSYLFAHSTEQDLNIVRQNSVFYLLDTMVKDDVVYIRENGKLLLYKVYDKKILPASDISSYKHKDPDKEVLILQTCWPLGTNWKRLLVFAQRVE